MNEYKLTQSCTTEKLPEPEIVRIPLSQHIGAPCTELVAVGDIVDKGQVIGEVASGLGCPVHSTVSGKVSAIEEVFTPQGRKMRQIIIENDGKERMSPDILTEERSCDGITAEELVETVRLAGISGMGGATFPTYAKIQSALGKVDNVIINGAECEPFITADHRLMIENPREIVGGARLLCNVFGVKNAIIAIEDNKPDAIKILLEASENIPEVEVKILKTKYPQGDERQIIYALTGKELPGGKLPADVGCVIFNVETCYNIYRAVTLKMPLIERIVTVSGDYINIPKNVLVPLGTAVSELIDFCGGFKERPAKFITGGPMMGVAQWDEHTPVTKGTNAVLAFSKSFAKEPKTPFSCLHCGKCVGVCPMHLMPLYLAQFSKNQDHEMCTKFNIMSCVECGSCAYICPGKVPIVQFIRMEKAKMREAVKK